MLAPPPKQPSGGAAMLALLVFGLVLAALLVWAFVRANPNRPNPNGTAIPKVMPAKS